MKAMLQKSFLAVLLAALLLLVGDWIVFEIRLSHGTAFDSVHVTNYLATSLKGNKTEYDLIGEAEQPCVRALIPHGSYPACWWLRRHKEHWE
jgi:hypothetical protein